MAGETAATSFIALRIAIVTVSDSRTIESDSSGQLLVDRLTAAGHELADRKLIPDCRYQLRNTVSDWVLDASVQVVITTGGTGLTGRDGTPEALRPLFDREIEGFGELFRWLSFKDVGTSTIASRAVGGTAADTLIFCIPGSPGACGTAWDGILGPQLDSRTRPCNLVELLPRLTEL